MVIFQGLTGDKKGINISSLYTKELKVLCKIIDGYSGICSYATRMTLTPGFLYYFSHFVSIYHRRFEVWNETDTILYLKVDVQDDPSPNLENLDKIGRLKNFKYDNLKDFDAALPLYEIFVSNLYDKPHCSINANDVVMDIGGNLGFFSYYAVCRGAQKVYCFEPSIECVKVIRDNFRFPNLIIEEFAVSLTNGPVTFYYDTESSMQSSLYKSELGNGVTCQSVNLFDYIRLHNIEKIDFLKIDCEGSEYDIIESLPDEYLTNHIKKMFIEFHFNTSGRLSTMLNKIRRCGFTIRAENGGDVTDGVLGVFYCYK